MARDGALISTWRNPVRGREAKALEVFMDFLTFWGKRAADGSCSEPEIYFADDGSHAMAIVRGKTDVLREIQDSEEFEGLLVKGHYIIDDLAVRTYITGDEEIQRGTRIYAEAGAELGYM